MIINHKRNSRSGFTLVELLVVMGIIAILAAVATPAYVNVLAHARTAKCAGNLRSIASAMITYAGDNNGNLPESGGTLYHTGYSTPSPASSTGPSTSWTEQLEPYLGASNFSGATPSVNPIFQCPDWRNLANATGSGIVPKATNANQYYSYFNGSHAGGAGLGNYGAVSLMKITAPSAHIIGGDIAFGPFQMYDGDPDDYKSGNTTSPCFGDDNNPGVILIHGGSVNLIFADGHEENVRKYDRTAMTTRYAGIDTTKGYSDYP